MNYDLSAIAHILPVLSAFLTLGMGIFVFLRRPAHPANIGFGLGMFCLSVIEGGNAIFILSEGSQWAMVGKRVSLFGEVLFPSIWALFSLTFARADYREILSRWKGILAILFSGSIFFIFWINSESFVSFPTGSYNYNGLPLGLIGRYFYIFIILSMIINLIHLENTLRFSSGVMRRQIKYLIVGVGAIFSFQIYLSSKALLFSSIDNSYIPVTSAIILISCGLMLFTIITRHLLDVNIFISRYVVYNSLTVLIVGVYLLMVGIVAQGIKLAGGSFNTFWSTLFGFSSILCLITVLLSTRFRRKVQHFITRHFYRHKYEFRDKWMETIEKIGGETDISKIQRGIVDIISETMGAKEVYLWLYDNVNHKFRMVASTITPSGKLDIDENHPLIHCIKGHADPFFVKDMMEGEGDMGKGYGEGREIAPLIVATRAVVCTPLIAGGELTGFILQGEDISGEPYRKDDLDLLKAISSHGAIRIKNIRLTQEVLAAKEAETFHQVSGFFIHDLKNLASTLSLLVQNAAEYMNDPKFQQDAMGTLKKTVAKMNSMISNMTLLLRSPGIDLQPVDLNMIIEETLFSLNGHLFSLRSMQALPSKFVKRLERLPTIRADGEQIRKVFLNLLLNAIESSPPDGEIEVQSMAKNGEVIFSVTDHGCGMSREFILSSLFRPFRSTKPGGLGIGLFQCKKIVEAHSGRIEVESEEGKGSEFKVVLPV